MALVHDDDVAIRIFLKVQIVKIFIFRDRDRILPKPDARFYDGGAIAPNLKYNFAICVSVCMLTCVFGDYSTTA